MSDTRQQPLLQDLSREQLLALSAEFGQPPFRAKQLFQWVHVRGVMDPAQMGNLPQEFRKQLANAYDIAPLRLRTTATSKDGSVKLLWRTRRGNPVEAVLMPGFNYGTVLCASSQSGCSLGCSFCETGYLGLREQLSGGQILAQLYLAEQHGKAPVDRLVLMGMGEPLLNLHAVRHVVDTLTNEDGRAWSPRRITVSTVGLTKPILEMARTLPRVNLALSLHLTTADKRQEHMPKAEQDTARLMEALAYYRLVNGGKISIEYALIAELNDRERDAQRLVRFARLADAPDSRLLAEAVQHTHDARPQPLPLHVNLIAYNPITSAPQYKTADEKKINEFAQILSKAGVPVSVRRSRGVDIGAACGQLGSDDADA